MLVVTRVNGHWTINDVGVTRVNGYWTINDVGGDTCEWILNDKRCWW